MKKISTKLILVFTAVLTGMFILITAAIQISSSVFTQEYVRDNIYSLHEDADESICAKIDEVAYSYARMVREDNIALLNGLNSNNSRTVRTEALNNLVSVAETGSIFADVGWKDEAGFLSVNGYVSPNESVFSEAAKNSNTITLGEYKNGCLPFVIYMKNSITETEGAFVFYMDETAISSCYALLDSETGYSYMIAQDGYILSHEQSDMVGKILYYENMYELDGERNESFFTMDGLEKFILTSRMDTLSERYGFSYYLVSVMDYDYYYGSFERLTIILFVFAVVIFVVGIVIAIFLTRKLSRPITELDANIEGVMRTGRKIAPVARNEDELYHLERKYDEMMDRLFALMEKSKEDAEEQRKLELDALQMQINPHFLYNTLDAVAWMAKIKKEEEIESLTVNLAKFFRLSLHKGDKFITVGEELELTEHYIEVYNIRFPGKVSVDFEVEEQIKNYKTLKLILQPIVENSLKYAFADGAGRLGIKAYEDGEDIVFEVSDNGVGFEVSEDVLAGGKEQETLGGFGIYNVNERIRLEYGEEYGLQIDSTPGSGARTTIRIAKRI